MYIPKLLKIATKLRKNRKVFLSYEAKKLAKHLSNADSANAQIFLCMGENEEKDNTLFYKNLENKIEKKLLIEALEKEL